MTAAVLDLVVKIGSGTERDVYVHPHDDSLIVKINRCTTNLDINKIEYRYYQSYIADTEMAQYFPPILGWEETALGTGLVVDCIRDRDGHVSRNLAQAMEERVVDYSDARKKIAHIASIAIGHGVFMRELDAVNILIRIGISRSEFSVFIVDGFGPTAQNIKTILRLKYPFLSRIKASRSWKQQMALLDAWAEQMLDAQSTPTRHVGKSSEAAAAVAGSGDT